MGEIELAEEEEEWEEGRRGKRGRKKSKRQKRRKQIIVGQRSRDYDIRWYPFLWVCWYNIFTSTFLFRAYPVNSVFVLRLWQSFWHLSCFHFVKKKNDSSLGRWMTFGAERTFCSLAISYFWFSLSLRKAFWALKRAGFNGENLIKISISN